MAAPVTLAFARSFGKYTGQIDALHNRCVSNVPIFYIPRARARDETVAQCSASDNAGIVTCQ